MMRQMLLMLAPLVLAVCTMTSGHGANRNVLFIAIDDLNDWIGCMGGHPDARTPHIDALAARGTLFTNAHCAAPACNPSRASVFSGRMPHATGVWSNQSPKIRKLLPKAKLLTDAFADAGYRTLGAGKLMGGKEEFQEYFQVQQRWSPFSGTNAVEYSATELPSKRTAHPKHVAKLGDGREIELPLNRMPSDRRPDTPSGESFDWGPIDVADEDMGDGKITDWAINQLDSVSDTPVFMGVGYYRPHIPLWAPHKYFQRFESAPAKLPVVLPNDLDDLSDRAKRWALEPITAGAHATVVQHDQWREAVEAYLACVTFVDHQIGRMIHKLDQSALADSTIIVLWSDHGWHLGEKEHWGKWTPWERSTRVPLIIVPAKSDADEFAPGGSRCDSPVSLVDLYRTLAELCDVDRPGDLDGQSLVPLLRDPRATDDRQVTTEFDPGNVSIRTQRFRFIKYENGSAELYDHAADPNEWTNQISNPDFLKQRLQFESAYQRSLPKRSRP